MVGAVADDSRNPCRRSMIIYIYMRRKENCANNSIDICTPSTLGKNCHFTIRIVRAYHLQLIHFVTCTKHLEYLSRHSCLGAIYVQEERNTFM